MRDDSFVTGMKLIFLIGLAVTLTALLLLIFGMNGKQILKDVFDVTLQFETTK